MATCTHCCFVCKLHTNVCVLICLKKYLHTLCAFEPPRCQHGQKQTHTFPKECTHCVHWPSSQMCAKFTRTHKANVCIICLHTMCATFLRARQTAAILDSKCVQLTTCTHCVQYAATRCAHNVCSMHSHTLCAANAGPHK